MPSSSTRNRRKWKVKDEPTIEMRKWSQWVLHAGGISFSFRGYVRRGRHSVTTVSGEHFDASEGDSMLMIIGPLTFSCFPIKPKAILLRLQGRTSEQTAITDNKGKIG